MLGGATTTCQETTKPGCGSTESPAGAFAGIPIHALDTALGLYLIQPTSWQIKPSQDQRGA